MCRFVLTLTSMMWLHWTYIMINHRPACWLISLLSRGSTQEARDTDLSLTMISKLLWFVILYVIPNKVTPILQTSKAGFKRLYRKKILKSHNCPANNNNQRCANPCCCSFTLALRSNKGGERSSGFIPVIPPTKIINILSFNDVYSKKVDQQVISVIVLSGFLELGTGIL